MVCFIAKRNVEHCFIINTGYIKKEYIDDHLKQRVENVSKTAGLDSLSIVSSGFLSSLLPSFVSWGAVSLR